MRRIVCAVLFGIILLCGCSKREAVEESSNARITGTITLSGAHAPGSASQLEISLADVSAEDGSVEIARQLSDVPEHFPAEYALPYRSSDVQAQHRYTVSARLLDEGRPQWATDTAYAVITQGNPTHIDIRLVKAGTPSDAEAPANVSASVIEADLHDAAGLASYRAHFQDTQLTRLEEIQGARRASYEFTGARLRRYESTTEGLQTKMEFDERGKLLRSSRTSKGVATTARAEDVDGVRNRADLLRSHALAQKEIQAHTAAH